LARADSEAARLLQSAGFASIPIDIEKLADQLGATIVLETLDSEVSGALYRLSENIIIAVNKDHPSTRQRFTIAHELGHFLLHQGRPVIVDHLVRAHVNLRDNRSSLATEREEIEANKFAASILMPPDLVKTQCRSVKRLDVSA
jgi:Zn-dependent peptidase ImmA (M78 family)